MKLSIYLKQSRDALINAVKNIDELEKNQQSHALSTINAAMKDIDSLYQMYPILEKKSEPTPFKQISTEDIENSREYKLMVHRLEPRMFKGVPINGYLETFHSPMNIPHLIEQVGLKYGGGLYQIKICDNSGKNIATNTFEISGLPKQNSLLPLEDEKEIFGQHLVSNGAPEYKLLVLRLEPNQIQGTKISGYLETFHLPTTIPDIIEDVGKKYGGGKFQIKIMDSAGRYIKNKSFEISGLPKIPASPEK